MAGATIQGLLQGLTFAVLLQWGAIFGVVFVVVGAGLVALHAVGGARRARSRGQRLTSDDVGFTPGGAGRRREPGADDV